MKCPCTKECPERTAECRKTCTRWARYWEAKLKEYKRREEWGKKRKRPFDPPR